MASTSVHIIFARKGLSNDNVAGEARGTVLQHVRPGAAFETGDFVK